MAHLAAGPHRGLAVKMHRGSWNREPAPVILDLAADEVRHLDAPAADRLAERPAGHRADVLLELRHRGAVERPMAGIVHPRRDLVDQNLAVAQHEHLDGEHADIVEFLRNGLGDATRLPRRGYAPPAPWLRISPPAPATFSKYDRGARSR